MVAVVLGKGRDSRCQPRCGWLSMAVVDVAWKKDVGGKKKVGRSMNKLIM